MHDISRETYQAFDTNAKLLALFDGQQAFNTMYAEHIEVFETHMKLCEKRFGKIAWRNKILGVIAAIGGAVTALFGKALALW